MATYLIALVHFGSELLVYRTTKLGAGLTGPLIVCQRILKC